MFQIEIDQKTENCF